MSTLRRSKWGSALIAALALIVMVVTPVFAHHNDYSTSVTCSGDWNAKAKYTGSSTPGTRLVLISGVKVHGESYNPTWSNAPTGVGTSPLETAGVINISAYTGNVTGLPTDPAFVWVGKSASWNIFSRSGAANFNPDAQWAGSITLWEWNGSSWDKKDTDAVTKPNLPSDCGKKITAKGEGECRYSDSAEYEWHWVITQLGGATAPNYIIVTWSNGDVEIVSLEKVTGGTAHYRTTSHASQSTLPTAKMFINGSWSGQFNLSHKPCGEAKPAVEASYECPAENVAVTFTNDGDAPATFKWTVNGQAQPDVEVAANSSAQRAVAIAEDATVTIAVTGPGGFAKQFEFTRNCTEAKPSAFVESQCKVPGGQLVITMKNDGDQEGSFTYTVNNGNPVLVKVPANDKKIVSLTVSDGDYQVKVNELSTGFEFTKTVNVDCEEPPAPACENITGRPTENTIPAEGKDYNIVFHTSGSLTKIKLADANGTVVGEITAAQGEYLPAEVTMKVHLLPDTAYFTYVAGADGVYVPAGNACALTAPTDLPPDDEPVLTLHIFLPVVTK